MNLEKLSALSAAAIPPLILCSCIQLVTYYSHWSIPILDYLSSSELLFSFVQPGLVFLAAATAYFGATMAFAGIVYLFVKTGKTTEPKGTREDPKQKKQEKSGVFGWLVGVAFAALAAWFFIQGVWFDYDLVPVVVFHVALLIVATGTIRKLVESGKSPDKNTPSPEALLVGTLITVISASYFYGRYQIHSTTTHPTPYSIVLADSTIRTGRGLIYLGKTTDYYFLYDSTKSQATIIPASQVASIAIGRAE